MGILNMNDWVNQYAIGQGLLNSQGQMTPAPTPKNSGLLDSQNLSQALLSMAGTMGQANQAGYGLGNGLAMGAQAFGGSLQASKDKIADAEKEATRDRLAAMKDIIGLKAQQEEMGLRMQAAALQRRAQQDALDGRAQERAQAEARRTAILNSGNPQLIEALQMFGDEGAKDVFVNGMKTKERNIVNVDGVPYYEDTKEPVVPVAGAAVGLPKLTEGQTTKKNLAEEALANYEVAKNTLFDGSGGGMFDSKGINDAAIGPSDILSGDGRTADQALRRVIQNTLYMKTGASAPDAEVDKNLEMYRPSPWDNPKQIQNKMNSLKQFLDSNIPAGYEAQAAAASGKLDTKSLAKAPNATAGFQTKSGIKYEVVE